MGRDGSTLVRTLLDNHPRRGIDSTAMMEVSERLTRSAASGLTAVMSEASSFYLKSAVFMAVVGVLLYVSLAAAYPPVHDALHDLRHGLAIVPCH